MAGFPYHVYNSCEPSLYVPNNDSAGKEIDFDQTNLLNECCVYSDD